MSWVYRETERGLYTVGYYRPDGEFETDSDYGTREDAARRVSYLNGGLHPLASQAMFVVGPSGEPNR
jgi:hypothetical protein